MIEQEKSTALTEAAFVQRAASAGFREIELGRLAMEHAESPLVKAFAGTVVEDHRAANQRLKKLADRRNIAFPETNTVVAPMPDPRPAKQMKSVPGDERPKESTKDPTVPEPKAGPGGTNPPAERVEKRDPKEHLGTLTGHEFDAAYLKSMIQGHRDAVALYAGLAKALGDAGLKSHAEAELPKLKEHLARAEQMLGEKPGSDPRPDKR